MRASDRTRVRRGAKKGFHDHSSIDAVLDEGLVAHVAFAHGGDPYCLPMLYAHVDDRIYVHGASASRTMRTLAAGTSACLTVTTVRALVLARSAFEHSANYESVMVFGTFQRVDDAAERLRAFEAFTEKLLPGRWSEVRPPSRTELKATAILALTIEEASGKRRSGPPDDDESADSAIDTWAGIVPILSSFGTPVASPGLRAGIPLAASVLRLRAARH